MRRQALTGGMLLALTLLMGCTTESADAVTREVVFDLYTHCGIDEVVFEYRYYEAIEPLSDGSNNPPPGWGNPLQRGRLRVLANGELEFRDDLGHVVRFRERVGATEPKRMCM